jgi:hypothetical protein
MGPLKAFLSTRSAKTILRSPERLDHPLLPSVGYLLLPLAIQLTYLLFAGYQDTLANGDVADFSDQAHIMINKKRWDPPANDGLDHRPLDTVNTDGLLDGYTALDQLKPLSETVFHELMHAVGGSKSSAFPLIASIED